MRHSTIIGTGFYVPPNVCTNDDLAQIMDTSDEWIQERTGIKQRYFADDGIGSADLAKHAAEMAIADADMTNKDIDMIIFATLNPDVFFPGSACILQSIMRFDTIPALDIRQQCTGFIYGMAIADRFIRSGWCNHILVIGAENHSSGLDFTTRGRDVAVLFGDGAGAVVMAPTDNEDEGVFDFALHAQGEFYDTLWLPAPYGKYKGRITPEMMEQFRSRGNMPPGQGGGNMDSAAMQRFMEMRRNMPQGGQRDSAFMRRMQEQGGPPQGSQPD